MYFKKGQLEIGVTMMVILVFIILLIVSLVVYFRFAQGTIKGTQQKILDEKYSGLLDALINLPELRYSLSGAEQNCLDAEKLTNFQTVVDSSLARKSEYYNNLLGDVNAIWIGDVTYVASNAIVPVNNYEIYGTETSEGLIYSSPVSICNGDKFEIGKLNIRIK